jgi:hypothetical protein
MSMKETKLENMLKKNMNTDSKVLIQIDGNADI